ncbi:MAG: DUF4264 family protein [Thermaerobacter sp.]|nr:DUF4264 family protein [Thermaerobacter sp.]
MKISANHDKLVLLGQHRFTGFTPYQVVTFLNQVLKARGLIVGLRQVDGDNELTIYDSEALGSE